MNLHGPSQLLAQYLVNKEVVQRPEHATPTWTVHETELPDTGKRNVEVQAIGLIDTAGIKQGRSMGGRVFSMEGCQVRIRAGTEKLARKQARAIAQEFDDVKRTEVTVENVVYQLNNVSRTRDPIYAGRDSNRNPLFTINVLVSAETVIGS